MNRNLKFDVIVVGGGMVGASLTLALQQAGFHVVLVERQRPADFDATADYGLRLSAISPASRHLFEHIGIWQQIAETRVSPYQHMHVCDASGKGKLDFDCDDLSIGTLGYLVENDLILDAAWQALEGYVQLRCPAQPVSLKQDDDMAHLTLETGEVLSAPLLVAADGPGSQIRQWTDIAIGGWGYDQRGVVCNVQTDQRHPATAWQRFLSTGPLAFLPIATDHELTTDQYSIVWSADGVMAQELLAQNDIAFIERLNDAAQAALGTVIKTSQRAAFPLRLQHADAYYSGRVALVGDAAHVIHPLAGQGVNLGLLDAACLVDAMVTLRDADRDWSSQQMLGRYQRARRADNVMMMSMTDALKRLHGSDNPLLGALRNLGMDAVNRLTPLKNLLSRQALGLDPELPALVRPPEAA